MPTVSDYPGTPTVSTTEQSVMKALYFQSWNSYNPQAPNLLKVIQEYAAENPWYQTWVNACGGFPTY